jgi:hypothetical protein
MFYLIIRLNQPYCLNTIPNRDLIKNTIDCSCMFWVFYLILLAAIYWKWASNTMLML